MRRLAAILCISAAFLSTGPAWADSGRLLKVLPQFLDLKGRTQISPSLYDRDAYQQVLRLHPEQRSGMRFAVQWKTKGIIWGNLKILVECRGIAAADLPKQLVIERTVEPGRWFTTWSDVEITGEQYKSLGEITSWRVSLWEDDRLLSEQKSFLW